jgi:(p)ppGpp synthase/HD superfamily hydrolase
MHSSVMTSPPILLGSESSWPSSRGLEVEKPGREYRPCPTSARSLLLQSTTNDIEETFAGLGRRLTELERLARQDSVRAYDLAQSTLESHLPLADRLGLDGLAMQLQDACFAILLPAEYRRLRNSLKPAQAEDTAQLAMLRHEITTLLARHDVVSVVRGRIKGLYSLYRKMCRRGYGLERVRDRVAIRIIVGSSDDCYKVMGLIHNRFLYVPGTFDDYIGAPKANGYQSLHTCISAAGRRPAEIQIRTLQMHVEAEYGGAAHWRYKQLDAAGAAT